MRVLGTQPAGYTKSGYHLCIGFGAIIAIAMFLVMLFGTMEFVCYHDFDMYRREYVKYDVLSTLPEGLEMDGEGSLMAVTEHMMKYLIGDKETPDLQIQIHTAEGTRDFFNDQELFHMAECKELFRKGLQLQYISIMLILFLLVYGRFAILRDKDAFLKATGKGLLIGAAIFFVAVAVLAVYMVTDFEQAFVQFHLIFFDNDLWMFDPNESLMINMLVEGFFYDVVKQILAIYVPLCALFLAFSFWLNSRYKNTELHYREK